MSKTQPGHNQHPYLSQYHVLFLPMVGFERGFVRYIGARNARVCIFVYMPIARDDRAE